MKDFIEITKNESDINQLSPLNWAYVGDCIYELYVRTYLINTTNLKPHKLHIETIKYVRASAQAKSLKKIMVILSDEEKEIVRRGRNTENHHIPKNSTVEEYAYSTAFEALIGYLYLTNKLNRVKEIIEKAVKIINEELN